MKYIFLFVLFFVALNVQATSTGDSIPIETPITLSTATGDLFGTLTIPATNEQVMVALMIAGSGPTDRDGNNPVMKNDALKKLAHELAKKGIASVRYDKRGIAQSQAAGKNESDLRFDDYVKDAKEWIELLKRDKRFSKVVVIGHSEGSLIGMIAGSMADKFISIAGAGRPADLIIKEQLRTQPTEIQHVTSIILDSLKQGKTVQNVSPKVFSLFRHSVQEYLISWFKYDPQAEIEKLQIPVMIVQGTADLQVTKGDAQLLLAAKPDAQLVFIDNMNHVLRVVYGDQQMNISTYSNVNIPIAGKLADILYRFIIE